MHTETPETTTAAQDYRRSYRDRADILADSARLSRQMAARDESEGVTKEVLRGVVEHLADLVNSYVDDVTRIINLHAELEEKTKEAEQWQATASALHALYGGWDPEDFEPGVLADLDDLGADRKALGTLIVNAHATSAHDAEAYSERVLAMYDQIDERAAERTRRHGL